MKRIFENYKRIPVTVKASVWYTICSIIQKSIAFLTVPIFTRMLTESEYGQFNIYQSWMNIILVFTTLTLHGGVFNNAMMKYEKDRNGFISSMQGLIIFLCGGWFVLYWSTKEFWNSFFELSTILIIVMFIEMAIQPAMNFWSGKQRYEYRYKNFVLATILMAIINPIVGIIAVTYASDRGFMRIVSNAGVIIAFSGVFWIYNFVKGKKIFDKEYWAYALKFNIPLIPYYVSQMAFTQSDRIMIGKLIGQNKAGIYSLALNCSMVVSFVLTAIESSYIPWLYKKMQKKEYKDINKTGNELLILVGIALIGITLIGPEMILIMGPEQYHEAIWVIPPVVGGLLFLFEAKLFIGIEFYYESKKGLVFASISSAIVNIYLNWLLIPKFGFIVAGYTTFVAYMLFALINYLYLQKVFSKENEILGVKRIYDISFIFKFSVLYIVISLVIMMIYPYFWLRAGLGIVALCIIGLNYKKIIKKINILRG